MRRELNSPCMGLAITYVYFRAVSFYTANFGEVAPAYQNRRLYNLEYIVQPYPDRLLLHQKLKSTFQSYYFRFHIFTARK